MKGSANVFGISNTCSEYIIKKILAIIDFLIILIFPYPVCSYQLLLYRTDTGEVLHHDG